jgi:toxin ParE1/3/4
VTRVRFIEEAEAELLHEVEYYTQLQSQGASQFREAVENAVARILHFPHAGPPYLAQTRRMFVQGYPFFLVYREERDDCRLRGGKRVSSSRLLDLTYALILARADAWQAAVAGAAQHIG